MINEKWIWLPEKKYPDNIKTRINALINEDKSGYTVAEFKKSYKFDKKIVSAELTFSADVYFELYVSGKIVATGPAYSGGDFFGNEKVRDDYYAMKKMIYPYSDILDFFARVRSMPILTCEYSRGRGGFMLFAELTFEDGTKEFISTDKSWQVRLNKGFFEVGSYDARLGADDYIAAEEIENVWNSVYAPIPVRNEQEMFAEGEKSVTVKPESECEAVFEFDKIYAGFVKLDVITDGVVEIDICCRETTDKGTCEHAVFDKSEVYRGMVLQSAGAVVLKIKNCSQKAVEISVSFIATCYPVDSECKTVTSDADINKVLDVCSHTLKYCRQLLHLDSPRHCEPLACTGDYYIEMLMTAFSFGDMRLAEFDVLRTARLIEEGNGRMFHTTYSLIWVRMLWDVYMFTGNKELLAECREALNLLLGLFETYIGDNGLIETPPDYMFIDWVYIDEISMHHPPKALGQTCLNMFYFGALGFADKIYSELSEEKLAEKCRTKREKVKKAINTYLYDEERGIYFEGLNTPTPEKMQYNYMPQNVEKRYYLKHSNVLAAYFGVCDDKKGRELLKKIISDEIDGKCQPYFLHYLFEAIYRLGMREEYTLKLAELWKELVRECDKGLAEGFYKPEPQYYFDHSHAWGGTPLWSVPRALLGLEIIKPGMKEIKLSPSLLGMEFAKTELSTPYGKLVCEMKQGEEVKLVIPKEIKMRN